MMKLYPSLKRRRNTRAIAGSDADTADLRDGSLRAILVKAEGESSELQTGLDNLHQTVSGLTRQADRLLADTKRFLSEREVLLAMHEEADVTGAGSGTELTAQMQGVLRATNT
jgi:hypothetical protein